MAEIKDNNNNNNSEKVVMNKNNKKVKKMTPGLPPGLTPGFLIHYMGKHSFRFCPMDKSKINNKIYWSKRILVNNKQENNILLFVEPLDYSKETTSWVSAKTAALAAGAAAARWYAAEKEFEDTGKILGGIFLTGNGKLIWVSHYDQEELMK